MDHLSGSNDDFEPGSQPTDSNRPGVARGLGYRFKDGRPRPTIGDIGNHLSTRATRVPNRGGISRVVAPVEHRFREILHVVRPKYKVFGKIEVGRSSLKESMVLIDTGAGTNCICLQELPDGW